MSRFRFELADSTDATEDAAIRSFLRTSTMPGRIELAFLREPSYFAPGGRFGPFHQTIVCRDSRAANLAAAKPTAKADDPRPAAGRGEIVGLACRSVRDVHIDGRPSPIGYLSALRSAERVRSGTLLARGYRYVESLHGDGAAPCYLTTIADGNQVALEVLTSNRAGLPRYRPVGRYLTFAIATRPRLERLRRSGGRSPTRTGRPADIDEVISFLASHGKSRQFYPVIDRSDFDGGPDRAVQPTFAGLALDDIAVGRASDGRIVATMAVWDQRAYRQTVVCGYDRTLRSLRPVHNVTASLLGRPRLPAPGEQLGEGYVALAAVEGDRPDVADSLLSETLRRASARGLDYVLFGCHENDPLVPVAERRSFLTYTTHAFVVSWPDIEPEPRYDPELPIHLEVGCL
jgi:hypothetical protein